MTCLNEFWDQDDQKGVYSCPQCRQTFSPRPALSRNTVLAEVVEKMERSSRSRNSLSCPEFCCVWRCGVWHLHRDQTKSHQVLSDMFGFCESHIQSHCTSPALKWHKLVNVSPHLQDQICSQHRKLLELYCCKDKQLICMQCALINHQNHSMTSPAAERQKIQVKWQIRLHNILHQ